jgi:hypothetical protein
MYQCGPCGFGRGPAGDGGAPPVNVAEERELMASGLTEIISFRMQLARRASRPGRDASPTRARKLAGRYGQIVPLMGSSSNRRAAPGY